MHTIIAYIFFKQICVLSCTTLFNYLWPRVKNWYLNTNAKKNKNYANKSTTSIFRFLSVYSCPPSPQHLAIIIIIEQKNYNWLLLLQNIENKNTQIIEGAIYYAILSSFYTKNKK